MTASPDLQVQVGALLDRLVNTGCVLTTAHNGRIDGCFATLVTGCSLQPARLLVLTSHENLTHELIEFSGVLAVHPVSKAQIDWVAHFGEQSGRNVDKFEGLDWQPGVTGSPILDDALGYIEGRVIDSMNCGDHTARLVEPLAADLRDLEGVPLTSLDIFDQKAAEPRAPALYPARGWPHVEVSTVVDTSTH